MPKTKKTQARKYYGSAYVAKDYRGKKSINLVLSRNEVLKLNAAMAASGAKADEVTLTIWPCTPGGTHESKITVSASVRALSA